ncbi:MAG: aminopeptidase P family protein [Clostridia bacterium]|nr:aminopeptidase P family protein [Clostridia bacterium]
MHTKLSNLLEKCDGILLTSPHNMRYFSGFSGGEGAVWISKSTKKVFTDSRYSEQAQNESKNFEVNETNNWLDEVCEVAESETAETIIFEDNDLSSGSYLMLSEKLGKVELCGGSKDLNTLRMVKTDEEIEIMQKAESIACRAFERIINFIQPGISEKAVAAELEYYIRQEGGDGPAFETIAISGVRCSLPHGVPTDKIIEKGDFVTMDFGALVKGYCSDMTRTVIVGRATEEQKKVYNTVKAAQQTGLEFIRAGILGKEADCAVRTVIEQAGYGEYFRHSLGHGVGLLIHELPNLSPKSDIVLLDNMIVTCEPGIYIPGFGGVRIEDMVCVKNDGALNLTSSSKELIEL